MSRMANRSLIMASWNFGNSVTVSSNNIMTSNPTSPGFGDIQTELKIFFAADVGKVLLEMKFVKILAHS